MPQINRFKKNTVLYLTGDAPDGIYLIKQGNIMLSSVATASGVGKHSESKEPNKKLVHKGEFFGLFSSLGGYPRQEDAVAYTNVEVLVFNELEFEQLVGKTPKLALQLMRLLSKELRAIHKKTREVLETNTITLLDESLYGYVQLYDKNNDASKVIYVATYFLQTHSTSKYVENVKKILAKYKT